MDSGDSTICCQRLLSASGTQSSPFGRIISLGFYDGTTSGVAQCSCCANVYKYDLLAWDSGQDIRIYSLASLPEQSFSALITLLSAVSNPTWPLWSPFFSSDTGPDRIPLQSAIDTEIGKAGMPTLVIASRHLEKEILAAKALTRSAQEKLPKRQGYPDTENWVFWRSFLSAELLDTSELSRD